MKLLSRVQLFATPWTVAYQAPWSMGFSRHEYWSGVLFPSAGDLPDLGWKMKAWRLGHHIMVQPIDRGVWPEKNRQRTGQLAVSILQ